MPSIQRRHSAKRDREGVRRTESSSAQGTEWAVWPDLQSVLDRVVQLRKYADHIGQFAMPLSQQLADCEYTQNQRSLVVQQQAAVAKAAEPPRAQSKPAKCRACKRPRKGTHEKSGCLTHCMDCEKALLQCSCHTVQILSPTDTQYAKRKCHKNNGHLQQRAT